MRIIDTDEFISKLYKHGVGIDPETQERLISVADIQRILLEVPTVEPKRGQWIDMGDFEQCSVCTGTHLKEFKSYYGKATWFKTPYCPWCGAKMERSENDG